MAGLEGLGRCYDGLTMNINEFITPGLILGLAAFTWRLHVMLSRRLDDLAVLVGNIDRRLAQLEGRMQGFESRTLGP